MKRKHSLLIGLKVNIWIGLILIIIVNQHSSAQVTNSCSYSWDSLSKMNIYHKADSEPEFPGGLDCLKYYLHKNLEYPNNMCIQGKIYISFDINPEGVISHVFVIKGLGVEIDTLAIRLIEKMPNWIPAKCDNEYVAFRMILPVSFNYVGSND